MKKTTHVLAIAATALLLAACGGGGGSDTPAATALVPASASGSTMGFMSYLRDLVASNDDTLDPVDASKASPPKDETGDPIVW